MHRALELDDFPGEVIDASGDAGVAVKELVFDFVDIVLESGDDGCILIDYLVEDGVQHGLWTLRKKREIRLEAMSDPAEGRRFRVANGDNKVLADEEVKLTEFHLFLLVDVSCGAQDEEQRGSVPLELGSLMAGGRRSNSLATDRISVASGL